MYCRYFWWLIFIYFMNRQIPVSLTQRTHSVVLLTPRSLTSWYYWHREVWLCGIIDTVESDFVVLLTPQSLTSWYYWRCGVWLRGIIDTTETLRCVIDIAESDFAVLLTLQSKSLLTLLFYPCNPSHSTYISITTYPHSKDILSED